VELKEAGGLLSVCRHLVSLLSVKVMWSGFAHSHPNGASQPRVRGSVGQEWPKRVITAGTAPWLWNHHRIPAGIDTVSPARTMRA
jgi:hypothetical protein